MKILAAIALFVLLGVGAYAQSAGPKMIAETTALTEKIVKGSPFSADAVNESVQLLADGNRIVHSSTNKLYRNSEGRFRREISGGSGGSFGSFYTVGPGITILDPVVGYRYLIDDQLKTARVNLLNGKIGLLTTLNGTLKASPAIAAQAVNEDKYKEEIAAADRARTEVRVAVPAAVENSVNQKLYTELTAVTRAQSIAPSAVAGFSPVSVTKYETRTEELGVQNIEGIDAAGTRTITTIPAGAIGNERPIEVIYEKWYSNELQLVVMSKHTDPRFGEQTYRLANIVRSEPDASLFEVPVGYKMVTTPGGSFTFSTGKGVSGTFVTSKDSDGRYITGKGSGQNVIYSKEPGAAAPVKKTKP